MEQTELNRLLQKYLDGTATATEQRLVDELLDALKATSEADIDPVTLGLRKQVIQQQLFSRIQMPVRPLYQRGWFRVAAAAAIIGIGFVVWMISRNSRGSKFVSGTITAL